MTRQDSTREQAASSRMPAFRANEEVIDRAGRRAVVRHVETDGSDPTDRVVVTLDTGEDLVLASALIQRNQSGTLTIPFEFSQIDQLAEQDRDEAIVIPVVTETVQLRKEERETGRVRITKTVHEREAVLEETVQREEVNVERVPVKRVVDEVKDHYYEGDTLVIPIYTEVLVVEKRLMLAEELRITKRRYEQPVQENVTLRDEEVKVERLKGQD